MLVFEADVNGKMMQSKVALKMDNLELVAAKDDDKGSVVAKPVKGFEYIGADGSPEVLKWGENLAEECRGKQP